MSDPSKLHVLPPHAMVVKLYKGQSREIDLRLVREVVREQEIEEAPRRLGHATVRLHFAGGADPLQIHHSEYDRVARAWRVQQERRAQNEPAEFSGENLDESDRPLVEGGDMGVYSWTPERDGQGKPEQVHLKWDVTIAGVPLSLVRRYKSKGALNEFIDALVRHREDVWPTT